MQTEEKLIKLFVERFLPEPKRGENRTILLETNVDAARPDIIAIYWNPEKAWRRNQLPSNLRSIDYRLLQFLHLRGSHTEDYISRYFPTDFKAAINRLAEASLIEKRKSSWKLLSLNRIFAIREILSFEAKLSSMSRAIEQAFTNTLFSSRSYVVTPVANPSDKILSFARQRGVGIWSINTLLPSRPLTTARQQVQPSSHLAWRFNELVVRGA